MENKEIIIEALEDYKKWFEGEEDKIEEIEKAIKEIESLN